jgi:predicted HAD superfamily Cof-like phosphohydrolase
MANPFNDQAKFMRACDQSVGSLNQEQYKLYLDLMEEEWKELKAALLMEDRVEQLDALLDFIVVTIGAVHSGGFDGEGGWKEVMTTNLAKIDKETGKVRKREDGKVLKPTGWVPPNLKPYVKED